jgi:hypothetical protein
VVLGGKAHPEPPLSSLAFGNASRTFHHHPARVASLALYYQCRDCAALPSRPPGSPQGEALIPDPRPLAPATVRPCNLAEPTGPAQVSRAYLYMVSPGRGVFQQPVRGVNPTDRRKGRFRLEVSLAVVCWPRAMRLRPSLPPDLQDPLVDSNCRETGGHPLSPLVVLRTKSCVSNTGVTKGRSQR